MTPKTFWTFFLRIFGLYILWQSLALLPQFFTVVIYATRSDVGSFVASIAALVIIACFYWLVCWYCLSKTDLIVDKLNLSKGMDDDTIMVSIHRSSLLTIAIIVLGGLMLADGIPLLFHNVLLYLQDSQNNISFKENRATPWLISNLVKCVIGYFMVTDSRFLVNFVERKRRKAVIEQE